MDISQALETYARTPGTLAILVAEASDELLDHETNPEEWPPRTILAHLRDVEFLSGRLRFERMLAEESPVFANFDEDAWAVNRNRTRDRKEWLLADFALQRAASVAILKGLEPADWSRSGSHPARGLFTVATWLEACVEHDAAHIAQLEAALGATLAETVKRRAHPD